MGGIDGIQFRHELSRVERLGLWVALIIVLATVMVLLNTILRLTELPFDQWWTNFARMWQFRFVALIPLVGTVLLFHPRLTRRRVVRWVALCAVVLLAAAMALICHDLWRRFVMGGGIPPRLVPVQWHTYFVVAALLVGVLEFHLRSRNAAQALHESVMDGIRLQSELATGRLQILQAQIEPHFLFNSLANVRRLLRIDGPAGRAMLGDLLRYLQIALPRMRAEESTLARELELVRAFLAVHQVRMGPRLRVLYDVPAELETRTVPPMMLLTLVENSLKHGLGPLPEGGTIAISAAQTAVGLTLAVTDTGRGIVSGSGHGVGLDNTRARLRSMYGTAASLSLRVNEPRGVQALILLPGPA
jgi:hypothetical protein